ncbi:MAG: HemK2/MTQ2 family protein methyltransferase [Candidatus Hodarchaeota archaeon]
MKYGDIDYIVNPGVYPPSEDTFLLIDSIELQDDDRFLDVGCGAGLLTLIAAKIVKEVVAIDVSWEAVRNARMNLRRNSLSHRSAVVQSDLLGALSSEASFTVISLNPPYLPRDELTTAYDHMFIGGETGVEVTLDFLHQVPSRLEVGGRVYVIASSLADANQVVDVMKGQGFDASEVKSMKLFYETLYVLRGVLRKGQKETVL